jgi:hypothetical protein
MKMFVMFRSDHGNDDNDSTMAHISMIQRSIGRIRRARNDFAQDRSVFLTRWPHGKFSVKARSVKANLERCSMNQGGQTSPVKERCPRPADFCVFGSTVGAPGHKTEWGEKGLEWPSGRNVLASFHLSAEGSNHQR